MDDSGYSSSSNTLAGELALRLSRQIDLIAASASTSGPGSSSVVKRGSDGGGDDNDIDEDEEEDYEEVDAEGRVPSAGSNDSNSDAVSTTSEEAAISLQSNPSMLSLQASLARIRSSPMPGSYSKLKESIDQAWKSEMELQHAQTIVSAASTSSSSDVSGSVADNLVWTVNAHLTASSYCAVLESLLNDAEKVKQEELYWQSIESRDRYSTMYLVQTMPKRIARSLRVLLDRLQYLASSPRPPSHLLSYAAIKRALPPSLLLTSLFPHLSASHSSSASLSSPSALNTSVSNKHSPNRHRSLLFLTLSPLLLTRQEVSLKRRELKKLRLELADKIGGLVRDAERGFEELSSLHTQNTKVDILRSLGGIMGQRIAYLEDVTRRGSEEAGNKVEQDPTAYEPRAPNELLLSLQQTVHKPILAHAELVHSRIQALSRPSRLTRAWPWLITVPLGSYILVTQLYNSRMTIYNYYSYARETFIGFMMDWVIEPTKKIFETLRHSDDGLSIMSKESLKSDFDSLERMVVQFAKDQQGPNLSQVELEDIGRNVRQGDLSVVLGAYEQDLKSPLKSAITGTLVRTLLIQVQKVKVDVDLAMDGIEKMLRSQQLTFAFVGVAPSMVLLYLLSKWARNALNVGESSSSKDTRRKVWYTLRNIDRLLTNSLDSSSSTLSNQTTGLLLIELTTLRRYASSVAFPTRDRSIRAAFLEDVRDLESDRGLQSRLRALDRLMRVWEKYIRV